MIMDARKGRLNRKRGISFEREIAALIGGKRTGMYGGKDDVTGEDMVIQCKVGTAFPERIYGWITSIPIVAGRSRAVVIGDSPGAGVKRRIIIAMELSDFLAYKKGEEDASK